MIQKKREIVSLNKNISRYVYQAAGAGRCAGAASMERRVAGVIPSVDHQEISNQLPAALPYPTHMVHKYS